MAQRQNEAVNLAKSLTITPNEAIRAGLNVNMDGRRRSAFELLSYPGMTWLISATSGRSLMLSMNRRWKAWRLKRFTRSIWTANPSDIEQMKREEARAIPVGFDYSHLPGLSNELKQKMSLAPTRSIAAAERIEGMTPAAMAIIVSRVRELERERELDAA